jgi:ABC-2 type transport system ATP-binding protein
VSADSPPAVAAAPAVQIRRLRVVRGNRAILSGLDLDIPRGQTIGLLGPSGSGKTTLMRAIVGVQVVAGGRVDVLGQPAGSPGLRRRVGYLTQAPSLYADLTVRENLRYFARLASAPTRGIDEAIAAVDLAAHADQVVARLSGGERSRASLAATLIGGPELLILDEPTVGLDPLLRRELWSLFARLADAGATLLVSSHVMDEAVHCDRLVLMRDGAVIADAAPADLLAATGAPDAERAFLAIVAGERAP